MAKVKVLPEALASQIAAGEVVERPASVVKELVENALDAEARSIAVLIEKSGKERIRVTDDGVGMSPEDARLALERHATSKLGTAADLSRISTLGFRGEALPSIASVSHFTLRTCEEASPAGYEIVMEGGKLVREREVGLARGTVVDVRHLFFNVPARRKFLRSEVTEAAHIAALVTNLAVSFPLVHFRLEHAKRVLLDTPPVESRRDRLFQIEGSWVESAVGVDESVGALRLQGWLSPPAHDRGNAQRLHLFVNARPVKDRTLTHAVMEAYRQVSSRSGTPLVYLFVELPPDKLDVNVHPAKTEVRFVDQRFVHQAVFSVLRNALGAEGRAPEIIALSGPQRGSSGRASGRVEETAGRYESGVRNRFEEDGARLAEALFQGGGEAVTPSFVEFATKPPELLGQYRDSFILAADEQGLWLVDQHAAHERILYEQLVEDDRKEPVPQQVLLQPLPLELTPSERVTLEEDLPRWKAFGFDLEPFGGGSFLLRAVPALLEAGDPAELVKRTLSQREQDCSTSSLVEMGERTAARLACHSAIKIHHPLAVEKMRYLLERLWRARQPTVCPHGRPTTLRLGLEQIERRFGRI